MITKAEGAEDSCPSCHQILVCRTTQYKDNPPKLQWQYKDREEAHFSYDFKTQKSACKETSGGSKASTTSSVTTEIDLTKLGLSQDVIDAIYAGAADITARQIVAHKAVIDTCDKAGITAKPEIGMHFNQCMETRRSE